ncbi:hypothetical protein PR048_010675 [Dryococelus australis]|uniref:G-protein coupled receptors family 1 profile domain-containing protein n=1 Tax=Dryococelus australis TaxID=614101 RepID=A0ABQ9I4G0_9NEOP|nr:hypothetical protein PR048_010675 [Dryococelus australis]
MEAAAECNSTMVNASWPECLVEEKYLNGSQPNNWTVADCSLTVSHLSSPYFQTAVYLLYGVIFLAALLGNGLVCHVVRSSPRMRTVTNYFIANLAVGDILMTLFCVPFSFVSVLLLQYWPFGTIMCCTVSYSQVSSAHSSRYYLKP